MNHSFVHLELNTDDIDKARAFYGDVFGWSFNDVPMGNQSYTQIALPQPPGGGMQVKPTPGTPTQWMPYVGVEDLHATLARARKAGARIVEDTLAVPGYGSLAIIVDPTGAALGLWEPEGGFQGGGGPSKKKVSKKKSSKKKASKKQTSGGTPKKTSRKKTSGRGKKKAAKRRTKR
jgi:hypothetical protein